MNWYQNRHFIKSNINYLVIAKKHLFLLSVVLAWHIFLFLKIEVRPHRNELKADFDSDLSKTLRGRRRRKNMMSKKLSTYLYKKMDTPIFTVLIYFFKFLVFRLVQQCTQSPHVRTRTHQTVESLRD